MKRFSITLLVVIALLGGWLMQPQPVAAATLVVTKTADTFDGVCDADCSLREAIQAANTGDVITLPAGTYTLSLAGAGEDANATGDLDVVSKQITINAAGAGTCGAGGVTCIDANAIDRVLHVQSGGDLTLNDLTITGGNAQGLYGGGIEVDASNLTLNRVWVVGNTTDTIGAINRFGGGIDAYNAVLIINQSRVDSNYAYENGGGISLDNGSTLMLDQTTISNNQAYIGGGLYLNDAFSSAMVTNSTISGNLATDAGATCGGIANGGTFYASNVTISGNSSNGTGAALCDNSTTLDTNLSFVTIANNTAGSGAAVDIAYSSLDIDNSIFANAIANFSVPVPGSIVSNGYNLTNDNTLSAPVGSDITNSASVNLNPLANNGGWTQTHDLQPSSAAIDAADPACTAATSDQRGEPRASDGDGDGTERCDIGAHETGYLSCGVTADTTYTFVKQSGVQIYVQPGGAGNLGCLFVQEFETDHPDATGTPGGNGIATGKYWTIRGVQADKVTPATGFTVNLTLPHSNLDNPKACKHPGGLGGYGWDCAADGSNASSVWRNGVTSFSDWAVGTNVGPTAVTLQQFRAVGNQTPVVAVFFGMLVVLGGFVILRMRRPRVV